MRYLFITAICGGLAIWLGTTVAEGVKQSFAAAERNLAEMGK
jgi:hypothetical protein